MLLRTCIIILLQCDLENAEVDTEMLNKFCQQHNLLGWFPTSVKENINIGMYKFWCDGNY